MADYKMKTEHNDQLRNIYIKPILLLYGIELIWWFSVFNFILRKKYLFLTLV